MMNSRSKVLGMGLSTGGALALVLFTGCSSEEASTEAAAVSLASLPGAESAFVESSSAARASLKAIVNRVTGRAAAVADIPALGNIRLANPNSTAGVVLSKNLFWPTDVIATIGSTSLDTSAEWADGAAIPAALATALSLSGNFDSTKRTTVRNSYFKGGGSCRMIQNTAGSIASLVRNTKSSCYMKKISQLTTGVTATKGSNTTAFTQGADDKVSKLTITEGGQEMQVFARMYGTNSVGNKVKVRLHFCQGGAANSYEVIQLDKDTGIYTIESNKSGDGEGTAVRSFSAKLNTSTFAYDPDYPKVSSSTYSQSGMMSMLGKEYVSLTGNQITVKRAWQGTMTAPAMTFSDKVFAVSNLAMSDQVAGMKFIEGSFKGINTCSTCGPSSTESTFSYDGSVSYDATTSRYISASVPETEAIASAVTLSSDEFYTLAEPSVDLSALSCTEAVDNEFSLDTAAFASVQEVCEGDAITGLTWQQLEFCGQGGSSDNDGSINAAEANIRNSFAY